MCYLIWRKIYNTSLFFFVVFLYICIWVVSSPFIVLWVLKYFLNVPLSYCNSSISKWLIGLLVCNAINIGTNLQILKARQILRFKHWKRWKSSEVRGQRNRYEEASLGLEFVANYWELLCYWGWGLEKRLLEKTPF